MSRDVNEKLKLLTPTSPDRDALLFAAGQAAGAAAARPAPVWKWACGILATSQVAMIAVWFSIPQAPSVVTTPINNPTSLAKDVRETTSSEASESIDSPPLDPHSYIAMMKNEEYNRTPTPPALPSVEKPHRILTPRWSGDLPQ